MLHLSAGRYAAFLWPAYGISALVLGLLVGQTLFSAQRWRRRAESRPQPEAED